MKDKKVITLDLTGCKNGDDLHRRIKEAFDFPDYYGRNWDAFHDSLSMECVVNKINIMGLSTLPKEFDHDIKLMLEILQDEKTNRIQYGFDFDFEIIS